MGRYSIDIFVDDNSDGCCQALRNNDPFVDTARETTRSPKLDFKRFSSVSKGPSSIMYMLTAHSPNMPSIGPS